jgi:phosphoenolpyruvate carboxykinase (GTP)
VYERCAGTAKAVETPIGNLPATSDLDLEGLDIDSDDVAQLLRVDIEGWLHELPLVRDYYRKFGDHLPKELIAELETMRDRLKAAGS